jgi:hypothetical protein
MTIGLLLAASQPVVAAASRGLENLVARTPVASPVGVTAGAPATPLPARDCVGGELQQCYETAAAAQFINVSTFFDKSGRCSQRHFFVKLFTPPAADAAYRIDGMSFVTNRGGIDFPSAGVVLTSAATPLFPTPEQLGQLQRQFITGVAGNNPTCVDLAVDVAAGQLAWLVVQFPEAADSIFVGIRGENDATDHPCDFFTRDTGDYYYRPDPQQSHHDIQINGHFEALPARPEPVQPQVWAKVKSLYR